MTLLYGNLEIGSRKRALEVFRGPLPPQRSARKDDRLSAKREFEESAERSEANFVFAAKREGFAFAALARSCRVEKGPARRGITISRGLAAAALLCAIPTPAFAMHISEGLLPASWAILWYAAAIPFVAWGLRNLRRRSEQTPWFKPLVGLVGAAVFLISCMPIPVPSAGTCSHPCGTGIAAILIGPGVTVVVASIALTLQALFLAHGGLTTLGANIVSMGVAGAWVGWGVFTATRRLGLPWIAAAFLAGMLSDWATYATTSMELAAALHGEGAFTTMFSLILLAFVPTQLPLGILEGFLCAGVLKFIRSRRPELLRTVPAGGAA